MSVYIEGFEMPKACAWCPMCTEGATRMEFFCSALDEAPDVDDIFTDRPDFCPLVEVEDKENV